MSLTTHTPAVASAPGLDPEQPSAITPVTWVHRLTWVGEAKGSIAAFTLGAGVLAAGISFLLPVQFTARATLLPPAAQQSGGAAAALAALGNLAGGGGALKTPDEVYVGLLRSDTLLRALDERFHLRDRYDAKSFESLRSNAAKYLRVSSEKKSGLITVEVDDSEPKFAAELANAHATELTRLLSRLAVSEAQQRRMFFAKQLEESNASLLAAERKLKAQQQASGLFVLDKQAESMIEGAALLRAQIAEREVRLRVLRTAATDQNPEAIRLVSELQGMRAELQRLEAGGGKAPASKSPLDLPVRAIPDAAADYMRALREMKYQEALFQGMLRQLEAARLDEAKEGSTVQQVDVAQPPERKSKPARGLITLTATVLAFLVSCLWTIWRRYQLLLGAAKPERAQAWHSLRQAWSLRKAAR